MDQFVEQLKRLFEEAVILLGSLFSLYIAYAIFFIGFAFLLKSVFGGDAPKKTAKYLLVKPVQKIGHVAKSKGVPAVKKLSKKSWSGFRYIQAMLNWRIQVALVIIVLLIILVPMYP